MIIDIMLRIVDEVRKLMPVLASEFHYIEIFGKSAELTPKPIIVERLTRGEIAYHFGDNKQNHGFVRIIDNPTYSYNSMKAIERCNYLNGGLEVSFPIKFIFGIYDKTPYLLEQAFLETLVQFDLSNIPNTNIVRIIPTKSWIFSEEAYKDELLDLNIKTSKSLKNLTCFAIECDVNYRWSYNDCNLIDLCIPETCCNDIHAVLGTSAPKQIFRFGSYLSFIQHNSQQNINCDLRILPEESPPWITGTLNEYLHSYFDNLDYIGESINYIEITDSNMIVFHAKENAFKCANTAMSMHINIAGDMFLKTAVFSRC